MISAESHYEDKLVEQIKTDPKRFLNYARHFSRSSSTVDALEHNGKKVTEDLEKVEIMNDFFCSVLTERPF